LFNGVGFKRCRRTEQGASPHILFEQHMWDVRAASRAQVIQSNFDHLYTLPLYFFRLYFYLHPRREDWGTYSEWRTGCLTGKRIMHAQKWPFSFQNAQQELWTLVPAPRGYIHRKMSAIGAGPLSPNSFYSMLCVAQQIVKKKLKCIIKSLWIKLFT
jgi:hypothetical protein